MKKTTHILVPVLVLAVAFTVVTEVQAGWFGFGDKDSNELPTKWRFDRSPAMNFATGAVSEDIYAGWQINGKQLIVAKKCNVVGKDGGKAVLRDGDLVVVMGPQAGNTIVAWQIRVMPANTTVGRSATQERIIWSATDPTVGEGSGPD